jgi:membrane-bound metal-dependent hydrolase YbcI (DUF457 family)
MPNAVTHVLIVIILLSLYRDIFFKGKKKEKFPLHYVLIGGIAGILPDLDVAIFYILSFFGFTLKELHRTFSHNVFVVLFFTIVGIIFLLSNFKNKELGRHHLKLHNIFFVISFGILIHLILDISISGIIRPFYPLSDYSMGFSLIKLLPDAWESSFVPSLDAALLVLWLIYMEIKHKVSDFI